MVLAAAAAVAVVMVMVMVIWRRIILVMTVCCDDGDGCDDGRVASRHL